MVNSEELTGTEQICRYRRGVAIGEVSHRPVSL
jgi:hypothetical protein